MLEEKKNKIKEMFSLNGDGNNKKKIENLVVLVIILIITIIIINTILKDDTKNNNKNTEISSDKVLAKTDIKNIENETDNLELEEKLEGILQNMEGVGKVKVLLTYSESSKTMAMYNEDNTQNDTQETDKSGGNRKVSQSSKKKEVIYQEINGEKIPVTQSITTPKIEGAIVTAVGAKNVDTKTNIIQAVEAVTGLATHKIQVFEMAN